MNKKRLHHDEKAVENTISVFLK